MVGGTHLLRPGNRARTLLAYLACLALMLGAAMTASYVQRGFGDVAVTNVWFHNATGIPLRAKCFRPILATPAHRVPGVVYIHGYQNNRETSDPFCIELSRRGFAALCIDAIGRGNSGFPLPASDPGFDKTFGAGASVAYLKSRHFVDPTRIGIMGHSMGASYAYETALTDPTIRALAISGFAFDKRASRTMPKNMLMVLGTLDELRERLTRSRDGRNDWLGSETARRVIPDARPSAGTTYGDFNAGTARRVEMPRATHLQVAHSPAMVAVSLLWMRAALQPDAGYRRDPTHQIWPMKEVATLIALIACLFSSMPLGLLLLGTRFFSPLVRDISFIHTLPKRTLWRQASVSGLLSWLYIPLCAMIYGVHAYVIRLDRLFPMMVLNGIVWWFFLTSLIGLFIFLRSQKRMGRAHGASLVEHFRNNVSTKSDDAPDVQGARRANTATYLTDEKRRKSGCSVARLQWYFGNALLVDLGIPDGAGRFGRLPGHAGKAFLLGISLFAAVYAAEHVVEQLLIVDLRFIFPFASDLTFERALIYPRYFPFLLFGFTVMGLFLHVRLRRPPGRTWLTTWIAWSLVNTGVLVLPLVIFLSIQYLPLFLAGIIPMAGPGGAYASLLLNLFQIIGMLMLVVPISTWFFQMTGRPYVGATLCAAIVTWMLVSSQVVAPLPL